MSELIAAIRAIVREELSRVRTTELGTVTQVFAKDGDESPANHQVNVKLSSSGIELQRVPVAVGRLGLSALPNEDDLVVVTFVGGDLNAPIVVGAIYDDTAHPPTADAHEVVYQPPDDQDSNVRRFHFELPSGTTLTFTDDETTLTAGDTTVSVKRDGDVTVASKGKISFQAQGDVEISAQGDLSVTAQGDLSLKGNTATIEGQTQATLKGAQVALNGITQFNPS